MDDPVPPVCQAVTLIEDVISFGVKVRVIKCDLSLGGHAIHVPAEAMWKHEVISGTEREYLMIHSLAELPAVLRG